MSALPLSKGIRPLAPSRRRAARFRPGCEGLEDRTVMATAFAPWVMRPAVPGLAFGRFAAPRMTMPVFPGFAAYRNPFALAARPVSVTPAV